MLICDFPKCCTITVWTRTFFLPFWVSGYADRCFRLMFTCMMFLIRPGVPRPRQQSDPARLPRPALETGAGAPAVAAAGGARGAAAACRATARATAVNRSGPQPQPATHTAQFKLVISLSQTKCIVAPAGGPGSHTPGVAGVGQTALPPYRPRSNLALLLVHLPTPLISFCIICSYVLYNFFSNRNSFTK